MYSEVIPLVAAVLALRHRPARMCLDFEGMRASQLRALLVSRSISIEGCFDKEALVERAELYRAQLTSVPAPPAWAGGEPVEQGPRTGAAGCLILLHGFGDSGGGFISSMGGPLVAMAGLRVVFPSAPRMQLGGFPVSSWLEPPEAGASGAAIAGAMMRAGDGQVESAVAYVHALIRREMARGVPAARIVVGGFSQGGLVATRAALSFADAPLGGALALSTFFGDERAAVAPANARLRMLVCHGAADGVVPPAEGLRLQECVARLAPAADVRLRTYAGMGHATCEEEVRDLRAFLQLVVGDGPGAAVTDSAAAAAAASAPSPERALNAMSAGQLKEYLRERGVPHADCFEKRDLLARAVSATS